MLKLVDGKRGYQSVVYNNQPLHSLIDPLKEAQNIVKTQWKNAPFNICIGVGLGYILDALLEKIKGLEAHHIIAIFLSMEELNLYKEFRTSNPLLEKQVTLALYNDRKAIYMGIERIITSASCVGHINTLIASSFFAVFGSEIKLAQDLIHQLIRYKTQNIATELELGELWVYNTIRNSFFIDEGSQLKLEGDVIIVAAGPSLMGQRQFLLNHKGKVPIVALDTALGTLYEWGLVPDFIASCDAQFYNYQDFFPLLQYHKINPQLELPILLADITHYYKMSEHFMNRTIFFQSDEVANVVSQIMILKNQDPKVQKLPLLDSGGSVASFALGACRYLGASRLVLVGQDFCYDKISHSIGTIAYNHSLYDSHRFAPIFNFYAKAILGNDGMLSNLAHWVNDFFIYYPIKGQHKDPKVRLDSVKQYNSETHLKGAYSFKHIKTGNEANKVIEQNRNQILDIVEDLLTVDSSKASIDKRSYLKGEERKFFNLLLGKSDLHKQRATVFSESHYMKEVKKRLIRVRRALKAKPYS